MKYPSRRASDIALLQKIDTAAGLEQVLDGSLDCGNGQTFLQQDVVCREVVVVYGDALGQSPSQASRLGNSRWIDAGFASEILYTARAVSCEMATGFGTTVCLYP